MENSTKNDANYSVNGYQNSAEYVSKMEDFVPHVYLPAHGSQVNCSLFSLESPFYMESHKISHLVLVI